MKKFIIVFLVLGLIGTVKSQDLDDVFDDGGISRIKNNVGISATDLMEGFLTINYERYIGEKIALGVRGGFVLFEGVPTYLHFCPFCDNAYYESTGDKFNKGFLMGITYKGYFVDHTAWFVSYDALFFRRNSISERENFFSFSFTFGYKWDIQDRISIIPSTGFGLGFSNLYPTNDPALNKEETSFFFGDFTNFGFYIPFNLNVAYDF